MNLELDLGHFTAYPPHQPSSFPHIFPRITPSKMRRKARRAAARKTAEEAVLVPDLNYVNKSLNSNYKYEEETEKVCESSIGNDTNDSEGVKVSKYNPPAPHIAMNSEAVEDLEADTAGNKQNLLATEHGDIKEAPEILTYELARKIMGLPPEPPRDHSSSYF